jgi:hypothetical protein
MPVWSTYGRFWRAAGVGFVYGEAFSIRDGCIWPSWSGWLFAFNRLHLPQMSMTLGLVKDGCCAQGLLLWMSGMIMNNIQ